MQSPLPNSSQPRGSVGVTLCWVPLNFEIHRAGGGSGNLGAAECKAQIHRVRGSPLTPVPSETGHRGGRHRSGEFDCRPGTVGLTGHRRAAPQQRHRGPADPSPRERRGSKPLWEVKFAGGRGGAPGSATPWPLPSGRGSPLAAAPGLPDRSPAAECRPHAGCLAERSEPARA